MGRPPPGVPNDSFDDFELAYQQLQQTAASPADANRMAIQLLARQISHLRHEIRTGYTRDQALRWKLMGDPEGKEVGGLVGEMTAHVGALESRIQSLYNLGKAVLAGLGTVIIIVTASIISGHVRFQP